MAQSIPMSDAPIGALRDRGPNLSPAARALSIAVGGVAALGVKRGGAVGAASGVAAAALLGRGITGWCPVTAAAGPTSYERAVADRHGWATASIAGAAVTVNAPREELYRFWRDFQNLPRFMVNIEHIDVIDDVRSHWVVAAPFGKTVEWDAIVTEDQPGKRIAWESAEGASVRNAGWVEFRDAPAGRVSEVHAMIAYEPPGGQFGKLAAKLTQVEPQIQARRDLKRFKSLVETGEIATNAPQGKAPKA